MDPLGSFFLDLFGVNKFVDIVSNPLIATWRNGHTSRDGIAKRLDCFLDHENWVERIGFMQFWVFLAGISNPDPIFLH